MFMRSNPINPNCEACLNDRHEGCGDRYGHQTLASTTMLGCAPTASYCCCEAHVYGRFPIRSTEMSSPRKYQVGDTIPGRGRIVDISVTAYCVVVDGAPRDHRHQWVPFYGPNGVNEQAPVEGLVTFVDGSRYGSLL